MRKGVFHPQVFQVPEDVSFFPSKSSENLMNNSAYSNRKSIFYLNLDF